jgi:hypothetical protein
MNYHRPALSSSSYRAPDRGAHLAPVALLLWIATLLFGMAGCSGNGASDPAPIGTERSALAGVPRVLSGTVFGGGAGLGGAVVEALEDGTSVVVASAITDAAGAYALTLAEGTFDLTVTPPSGSGFTVHVEQNVVLGGADARHDIVLIAEGGSVSGRVSGHGGVGMEGATVAAQDANTGVQVASTVTGADGKYSLSLGNGTYRFYVRGDGLAGTPNWYAYYYSASKVVSGSTIVDIDLPVAKVEGTVTDPNGAPVEGVSLTAQNQYSPQPDGSVWYSGSTASSDAAGHYQMLVFTGVSTVVVAPALPLGTIIENLSVAGDLVRDYQLREATLVSGRVSGHGGVGVEGATVAAQDANTGVELASTVTGADGKYSLSLSDGTYRFYVRGDGLSGAPNWYFNYYSANKAVSGSTIVDIDLPVAKVEGTVTDSNGAPVGGVSLNAQDQYSPQPDGSAWYSGAIASSDAAGHYEMLVFTGVNTVVVAPALPLGTIIENLGVAGDVVRDYQLSEATLVSGRVSGHGGVGVEGATVAAQDANTGVELASTVTGADGKYSLSLSDGTYRFYVRGGGLAGTPNWYSYYYSANKAVSGSTIVDIDLPVAKVEGTVTDSNGAPVAGVSLTAQNQYSPQPDGSVWYSGSIASSDAAGHYQMLVFTGGTTITITPPALSGFSATVLANVSVSDDFSQLVVLQHPDLSPPVITSGPLVVHLSDTSVSISWSTNEPADSITEFGPGSIADTISDARLVTRHQVTLVDLLPSTIYAYRVSSTDGAGNGPVMSGLLTFRTQDPPGDITAPVITAGPSVTSLGQTDAALAWTTDEPATSVVHYGTTTALGSMASVPGEFTPDHSVAIAGLTPNTTYYYAVESTDPDENGPTTSDVRSFTTAAVPDTMAPLIVAGPAIVNATDTSLTVVWTTNEAATSGVSYNDGTVFHVITDDALVTSHSLVLAGLDPDTLYEVTVSSVDLAGNGPTLGGPISARTLAAADVRPPVISNLRVENVTTTSATVRFATDEAATTELAFGTVSGALDGLAGSSALVTDHTVVLNGLTPGATYFLVASARDGSGNATATNESSFRTTAVDIDNDGDDDGVPDKVDACLNTAPGAVVSKGHCRAGKGCSIAQLCPCAGPRDTRRPWGNHGKYVECVTDAAEEFWKAKLVSRAEKQAIVKAAAQSTCGKGR